MGHTNVRHLAVNACLAPLVLGNNFYLFQTNISRRETCNHS